MSGHSRKYSTSNCQSTDHDEVPPKHNTSQRRRPEEFPTREIVPLTQEDIPRIIEGVVKSITEIDSQSEPTTSDYASNSTAPTTTTIAPATTMTTCSTGNSTPNSDGATTPHSNNSKVELPPAHKLHSNLYINYILIYVICYTNAHIVHLPDN